MKDKNPAAVSLGALGGAATKKKGKKYFKALSKAGHKAKREKKEWANRLTKGM